MNPVSRFFTIFGKMDYVYIGCSIALITSATYFTEHHDPFRSSFSVVFAFAVLAEGFEKSKASLESEKQNEP